MDGEKPNYMLVSLYGLMDEERRFGASVTLRAIRSVRRRAIQTYWLALGGDLNTWSGWSEGSAHLARDANLLERIAAYGLIDVLIAMHEGSRLDGCPCSLGEAMPPHPHQGRSEEPGRAIPGRLPVRV